jgi:hypothetical protein
MSIPFAIAEIAIAAARPAWSVSDEAAITAGVEAVLALDRRSWGRRLLNQVDHVAVTERERAMLVALADELFTTADEIDQGAGQTGIGQSCRDRLSSRQGRLRA